MLSRLQSQPSNGFADYPEYTGRPHITTSHPHLPSILHTKQKDYGDNLQAGRKRRESEIDSIDSIDSNDAAVRRRISRACDQCNQLRTKCDGKNPCAHCTDNGLPCEYARAHKKRGRAPKKEVDQSGDDSAPPASNTGPSRPSVSSRKYSQQSYANREAIVDDGNAMQSNTNQNQTFDNNTGQHYYGGFDHATNMAMSTDGQMPNMDQTLISPVTQQQYNVQDSRAFGSSNLDGMQLPSNVQGFGFPLGDDYSVAFMGKAPMVESPDWLALTSPMYLTEPVTTQPRLPDTLRYPVLRPLLPHIESIIPQALACDLLEQYFTSSTSAYLRPSNPYILGNIFRKKSILHPTDPRPCTPALLSSMLWIAAQTSDAAFLATQLDARGRICQKLLELTISMLKPLIHSNPSTVNPTPSYHHIPAIDAGLGGLLVSTEHSGHASDRAQVDSLATYIHLATVVSASERKAASLRWWNAAWSLARETRLGRELPPNPAENDGEDGQANPEQPPANNNLRKGSVDDRSTTRYASEEEREERRRTWWLLYMQDRHLALCYNRPMFFLNKECEELLQPLDDDVYQSGMFDRIDNSLRRHGLNIECTSHSIFGYFLPLMVILGEILDLNHTRNRPRFGPRASRARNWNEQTDEITQQLEAFGRSLREFEAAGGHVHDPNAHNEVVTPSVVSAGSDSQTASEFTLQTRTTVAYGMHIMHVLHILLTGKWDPIALLDDNDLWISSQSFVTATGHAVSAAEAVADVIEYDPDLSFMPFFFGIYLLQGSFLLLLFADKLQGDVSPDVVKACETIVRAHEACVATLDTQYQASSPMLLGLGNANDLTAKFPQGDAFSAAAGPRQNPAGSRGTATVEERGIGFVSVDW
jgi:xylanolytic transcriptional activator XlnR